MRIFGQYRTVVAIGLFVLGMVVASCHVVASPIVTCSYVELRSVTVSPAAVAPGGLVTVSFEFLGTGYTYPYEHLWISTSHGGPSIACHTHDVPACAWHVGSLTFTAPTSPGTYTYYLNGYGSEYATGMCGGSYDNNIPFTFTVTPDPAGQVDIGDYVWLDYNMNGQQDTWEPPLPYVRVLLYAADGTYVASTQSSPTGHYRFTVSPGSYFLWFYIHPITARHTPSGYTATDSDPYPYSGVTDVFYATSDRDDIDCGVTVDLTGYPGGPVPRGQPPSDLTPPNDDDGDEDGDDDDDDDDDDGDEDGENGDAEDDEDNEVDDHDGPHGGESPIDVHVTYCLIDAHGNRHYGTMSVPHGSSQNPFSYGTAWGLPMPASPGAGATGAPAQPGQASITFGLPASGPFPADLPTVAGLSGSSGESVAITSIRWTLEGEPVGPILTHDPAWQAPPSGSNGTSDPQTPVPQDIVDCVVSLARSLGQESLEEGWPPAECQFTNSLDIIEHLDIWIWNVSNPSWARRCASDLRDYLLHTADTNQKNWIVRTWQEEFDAARRGH